MMDWHCQKWGMIGYWLGVASFAISPNWTGIFVGWGITQICAAVAG